MYWNQFLSFVVLLIVAGVLYELFDIWRTYITRPPRPKCNHKDNA